MCLLLLCIHDDITIMVYKYSNCIICIFFCICVSLQVFHIQLLYFIIGRSAIFIVVGLILSGYSVHEMIINPLYFAHFAKD